MSQAYATKTDAKSMKSGRKPQGATNDESPTPRKAPPATTVLKPSGVSAGRPPRLPPHDGCLVCKGPHWLMDCPTATDAQHEEARKRFRETKEQRSGVLRSKAARYMVPDAAVRLNGLLEVPYSPDAGADKSIIPQAFVDSLRSVRPTLVVTPLRTPVDAKMADGSLVRDDNEVVQNLDVVTIAGPVLLRSVACVILVGEGDEFLLSSDALKMLGIDIQNLLAQLAGSPLLDAEDDEFPVCGELPNDEEPPEYDAAFGHLPERAVANGLPREHVGAVRELLVQFPDAWREAIGQVPPANVEPLRVPLRQDAVPFRSPPRKYAPLQTQFIREYVKSLVDTGLVEQNNASRWACAVVPVRKPGTLDQFDSPLTTGQ
ncbi:unnamed protein product [Phytophthora fragariaefolia]|uniref:Unnamed protein product n=1 Tax=Phytophthora fragariaefolia TaxID=1490495 RepID=A0A9W6TSJ9_9STRA|nr:unnamed protein product [Phytophthora fragariaefolia]